MGPDGHVGSVRVRQTVAGSVFLGDEDGLHEANACDGGTFTICAECSFPVVVPEEIPESLRKELEADREEARKQPVVAAVPMGGWDLVQQRILHYPEKLKESNLEGTVIVEGRIGMDGFASAMRVASAGHLELAKAAVAFMRDEQWEPARVQGVTVAVACPMEIVSSLRPKQP